MPIVLRRDKGSALTHNEVDENFETLEEMINDHIPMGAVSVFLAGGVVENEVAWLYPIISDFKLPVDAAGSVCIVSGAASFVLDIRKNNASIGAVTIGSGVATFTIDDEETFTNGDELSLVPDSTAAMTYVAITFKLEAVTP